MMATAAAVTAAGVAEVFGDGDTAGFERFGDVFLNRVLKVVKFLLRIEEAARDGIGQQRVALFLEIGDFRAIQRQGVLLFFLKHLALGDQAFVLAAGGIIGQKSINLLARGAQVGQVNDGLAQFAGLLRDGIFFNLSRHKMYQFFGAIFERTAFVPGARAP